ncbi:unnamed protein product, partial [Gulo gulo]
MKDYTGESLGGLSNGKGATWQELSYRRIMPVPQFQGKEQLSGWQQEIKMQMTWTPSLSANKMLECKQCKI